MTVEQTGIDTQDAPDHPARPILRSLARGFACRCPECGKGRVFSGYLTVNPVCSECSTELHHHRADDAPPYFTIFAVGHVVIPGMLLSERYFDWTMTTQIVLWVSVTIVLALALLRPIKGALIGLQWALRMHGFDPEHRDPLDTAPAPERA